MVYAIRHKAMVRQRGELDGIVNPSQQGVQMRLLQQDFDLVAQSVVRRAINIHYGCTKNRARPGLPDRAANGLDCLLRKPKIPFGYPLLLAFDAQSSETQWVRRSTLSDSPRMLSGSIPTVFRRPHTYSW